MVRYGTQCGRIVCDGLGVICGKYEVYTGLLQSFLIRALGWWSRLQPV
jgi:hypothetical protein